jgi:Galactose oxidase, central domain
MVVEILRGRAAVKNADAARAATATEHAAAINPTVFHGVILPVPVRGFAQFHYQREGVWVNDAVPFRARRSMTATACGSRIYFFGGVGAKTGTESILDVSDELWVYEPSSTAWAEVPHAEPWPEARRCNGFAADGSTVFLWGGSGIDGNDYTFLSDLWRLDVDARVWAAVEPSAVAPGRRYFPVFECVASGLVMFGGYTETGDHHGMLDDTWVRESEVWRRVEAGVHPVARYGATVGADGDEVVVFGGMTAAGDVADVWRLDAVSGRWTLLDEGTEAAPAPRYCAAGCIWEGELLVFGGRSRVRPKENYSDLWAFNLASKRWRLVHGGVAEHRYDGSTQTPAYHAKTAHARLGDQFYMWGGEGRDGHVSDFWRLHLSTLEWELLAVARSDDPRFW